MASFAIYQFLIGTAIEERDPRAMYLDFGDSMDTIHIPTSSEEKQEAFQKIFDDTSTLEFKENENQKKLYPYKLIPCEANKNIIIIRIAANKKKDFEQNFTDVSVDWNPSTLIIIDNRKDIQRIAIQVKRNAFSTRHLAELLQKVLGEKLKKDHLTLEIAPKMYSGDFWKVTDRHKGRIQYVKFNFTRQYLKYDEAEKKQYDTEAMAQHYEHFCELEQEEIQRYKNKEKKDDRSTIGAGGL